MALALNDRVKETTTTVGTGSVTLLGASIGFESFAVIGNANTTYYCIADQGGPNWEVGIGTYTSAGTTLARTTVLASSNAGGLVTFVTGVKDVFVTYPSEKGVWYDASGNVLFTGTTTAANLAYTGTLTGSTGILNIGSGQVYKDASGNVGIGTSSPRFKLSIGSTTTTATATPDTIDLGGTFSTVAGANLKLRLYWNGTDQYGIGVSSSQLDYFAGNAGGSHVFYTTNTERMRIDSSGNVGIGTSSPVNGLTVVQSGVGAITALNVINGNGGFAAGTGPAINFGISSTSTTGSFGQIASLNQTAGSGSNSYMTFSTRLSDVLAEKVRIDASGNVGIGTSSPNAITKLHVANANIASLATQANVMFTTTDPQGTNIGSFLGLGGSVTTASPTSNMRLFGAIRGAKENAVDGDTAGYLSLLTMPVGSVTPVERMRINSSGILLIGTTAASGTSKLQVSTDALINGLTIGLGGGSVSTNMAFGNAALTATNTGFQNTAIGYVSQGVSTSGNNNTSVGYAALQNTVSGSANTVVGSRALVACTGGGNNAFGFQSLIAVTSGGFNCAYGYLSGNAITTGSSNVIIGGYTGSAAPISATGSNYVVLSDGAANIRTYYDASGNKVNYGVQATSAAAPTIASATTIAPTKAITFISGVTPIVTITAPSPISLGGGTITLIPTGIFTTTTAGNIALASTAVVSKALIMTYDVTTAKWYPSY